MLEGIDSRWGEENVKEIYEVSFLYVESGGLWNCCQSGGNNRYNTYTYSKWYLDRYMDSKGKVRYEWCYQFRLAHDQQPLWILSK